MNDDRYFFGESFTTFSRKVHVIQAAWLTIWLDIILLLSYALIIPLTVGYFDALCFIQLCVSGAAICSVIVGMLKEQQHYLWFLMFVKGFQLVLYVLLLSFSCIFAIFNKAVLLRFISLRFRTITNSNAEWHIALVVLLLLVQMFYNLAALQALYNAYDYFRLKNAFKYEQSRREFFGHGRQLGWV
ncbi:unnamed protein product, partial [Mesorhabditis spiculigera]